MSVLVVLVSLGAILAGCGVPAEQETIFQGPTMGTSYTVKVVAGLSAKGEARLGAAVAEALEGVNRRMSTYLEDSELSRLNRFEGSGVFALSAETLEVLQLADEISAASGGAFDITVGPMVDAWGFGPEGLPPVPPSEKELTELFPRVGYRLLEVSPAGIRKLHPQVWGDLNAIAKGYAVDRVARVLEEAGVDNYMVEVGGEIRTAGASLEGGPWRIGIEGPTPEGRSLYRVLPLSDLAIATSGDYRNFYEVDGTRFSHTIDPKTGRPVKHSGASVSVVMESCASADAWATALLVLGPKTGFDLAIEEKLAVLFLVYQDDGEISSRETPAFEALFGSAPPG